MSVPLSIVWCDGWLRFERAVGPDAVTATYLQLLDGRSDPAVGHLCTLASTIPTSASEPDPDPDPDRSTP